MKKEAIVLKKYRVIMNNVDKVTDYVDLVQDVRTIYMNSIFAQKKLKKLAQKIPRKYDIASIKKFEKETGLILKYYIFTNKYDFLEYTHLGVFPDNERLIKEYGIGKYPYEELMKTHLEQFDILIIDKISKMKKNPN